jgi:hypothetical protein
MKLTIEEANGESTELEDVRHISITDTEKIAVVWWEKRGGEKFSYEELNVKPVRIVLEFPNEPGFASANYGQR